MKTPSFSELSMGVLMLCSIIVAVIIVKHEINKPVSTNQIKTVSDWHFLLNHGHHVGPPIAPVKIIEFSDFQCPYCKQMEPILKHILKKYPSKVEFIYYSFPLPIHPQALPAAKAAECAALQHDFFIYHDILYQNQTSFSHQPWDSLCKVAGIKDLNAFNKCLEDPSINRIIEKDIKLGKDFGVYATPTVIMNGKMIVGVISESKLDQLLQEALKN